MDWLIDLVKWLIPTIIAIIGVAFGILQRKIAKEEISKKRHLESALTNLNNVIEIIEGLPARIEFHEESNVFMDTEVVIDDILRASLTAKKKVVSLEVSYFVEDHGDPNIPIDKRYPYKKISLPKEYDPDWLLNVLIEKGWWLRGGRIKISTRTEIKGYTRKVINSPDPDDFLRVLHHLLEAENKLLMYEEVYETLAYHSLNEIKQVYKEIGRTLFELIRKEKRRIKVDLDKLNNIEEMREFLWEQILNYSGLRSHVLKTSKVISSLKKARKELFLKLA